MHLALASPGDQAPYRVQGFEGTFSFLVSGTDFANGPSAWLDVSGDGSNTKVLVGGVSFVANQKPPSGTVDLAYVVRDTASPKAAIGVVTSEIRGSATSGDGQLADWSSAGSAPSDDFVRAGLAQLRGMRFEPHRPRIPGVTDVQLYRVSASGGGKGSGVWIR